MKTEDKKMVDDFLSGDEESFERLVGKYLSSVYNFIHQMTQDRSASDDLTQETFIKAWKNIKKFDTDKSFKTWIFTIAKNTTFDYFKKKKTVPFSFFEDSEGNNKLENVSDEIILPDEILMRQESGLELEKKLEEIPEKYRVILNLCYREDFSLLEISEILKIPYNTVKSGHGRALRKLREVMEQ